MREEVLDCRQGGTCPFAIRVAILLTVATPLQDMREEFLDCRQGGKLPQSIAFEQVRREEAEGGGGERRRKEEAEGGGGGRRRRGEAEPLNPNPEARTSEP
jgi:hypothetical protein